MIADLQARGLRISSWYGAFGPACDPQSFERINRGYGYEPLAGAADDHLFPWFLYWEIAWLTINNDFAPGQLPSGAAPARVDEALAPGPAEVARAAEIAAGIADEKLRQSVQKAVSLGLARHAPDRPV